VDFNARSCALGREPGAGADAVHDRQYPVLIDSRNDLEAREELVAIISGDRTALCNLYTRYFGILAHFLSQYVGSENCVGDIINDTFMTIWEKARGFQYESKVSVWIFSIAHSHASRFVQWHRTRESAQPEGDFEGRSHEPRTPTGIGGPILWAFGRLRIEQRVVLTLCYRMGYSAQEIALITDSPVETVELRMSQGRRQLRRYLMRSAMGAVDSNNHCPP
jgi:RNA polymerase sigma-70 factor (ECF subfamily)